MRATKGTTQRGREGETLVASTLAREGWSILERNYRWKGGEIDIVASRDSLLAFVEVKSWDSMGPEELERAIGADKRRRIIETAKIFLSRHREYNGWSARFDVVLVRGNEIIERYASAFTGEL